MVNPFPEHFSGFRRLALLAIAAALPWPGDGVAQVFKCAGERNQPVYQDHACPPGKALRDFTSDPAEVSVIASPPASGGPARGASTPAPRPRVSAAPKPARTASGNPAERRFIHAGMQQGEVVARIGAPDLKSGGANRRLVRWTYMPVPEDPQTLTTIVFDSGRVVEVERKMMR